MASTKEAKEFINEIAPLIQAEAKSRGYKVASPIIAQACLESGYNTSLLSKNYHNYFGLKCGSSWRGASVNMKTKEEYTVGVLTTIKDNFRVYDSMEDGVKGYFDFISTKRYANLKDASTPKQYLEFIKADGYATSSSYVNNNMNVINKYDLTKYDGEGNTQAVENNPYNEPNLIVTSRQQAILKGVANYMSSGSGVKWVQFELNRHGANLDVDGKAGIKTVNAIVQFQTANGLKVDGLAGYDTRYKLKAVR